MARLPNFLVIIRSEKLSGKGQGRGCLGVRKKERFVLGKRTFRSQKSKHFVLRIINPLRIEPSFNYFFENDNVSMLDLNVNFHYLCPVAQSVKLYPLFGLTMSNWMFDMHDLDVDWDGDHVHVDDGGNHNEFRIGVNLGAGAEFALGRNWAMNVEFRYQLVDDFDQGVINFGAAYRF